MSQEKEATTVETSLPKNDPWTGIVINKAAEQNSTEEISEENSEIEDEEEVRDESDQNLDTSTEEQEQDTEADQEQESDENLQEETSNEDDGDETEEPNPYYFLGGKLKQDGFLSDDYEIDDKVTGIDVYNAYRKKLESELEPRIQQEVYSKLEAQGVNENDIVVARALRQGIDVSLLSESTMHERYSSLAKDVDREEKMEAVRAMYKSRNFTDREIENQISIATDDEDASLDDYFSDAKNYHLAKWKEFKQQEDQRVTQQQEQLRAQQEQAEHLVQKILTEQQVMGEVFSREEAAKLREAIYSPSDTLEYQGQKYTVSPLYKFNRMLETDPELKLWLFKKYLFKDTDLESIKKEVKSELEDDLLKAYEKSVKKDIRKRKPSPKSNKKEVTEEKKYKNSFTIDLTP